MLKQYKNRWFKIVDGYFLNGTSDIEGVETDDGVFVIKLRNSPLVFMIKQKTDDYDSFNTNFTIFKPGYPL